MHFTRSPRRIFVIVAVLAAALPFSAHAAQEAGLSHIAIAAGDAYLRTLQSAAAAYSQRDFTKALARLDVADQIAPNIPDSWGLRGAIYAEMHQYDKAEDAFEKAASLNPSDFWPKYNLAELLLEEKKYNPAIDAFQKLEVYRGREELVQFKIIFANLLAGHPDAAQPVLDAMKFPCDTPAYYFAHAASAFAQKNQKEGNSWAKAGLKVFGLEQCMSFYDSLATVGWLPVRNPDGTVPDSADLTTLPAVNLRPPAAAP